MRFFEIKPIKPLTPAQARVRALKLNVEKAKQAVDAERINQQRQKELERSRKRSLKLQQIKSAV
jgi:hypothetical protein